MKTIGIIGGMSWESTAEYYRIINQAVHQRLGGHHSAPMLIHSVDFHQVEHLQRLGDWDALTDMMQQAGVTLARAGAQLLVIATNTMHKMADQVQAAAGIPLLHIADALAAEILNDGLSTVGLLGTRFTMEQPFYRDRLLRHGIQTLVPDAAGCAVVDGIIFDELVHGKIRPQSQLAYRDVMHSLADQGAQAMVLGCTEIPLLLAGTDFGFKLYDTVQIHAQAAVQAALE